jgi:TatD DNase family protein
MLLDELTHHRLFDAHLHLPFFTDPVAFAEEARRQGLALFSQAVTPAEYLRLRPMLEPYDNVRQGVGIHPLWIADGRCGDADVDAVVDLMGSTPWVGEVGLDFGPRRPNREGQVAAFRRIARAAGAAGDKVLSIHAVRSVSTVLDILEECGCTTTCTCIIHWFSGSTEELWRAIRLGCFFSVNEMQAKVKRSKEQLRLIDEARLLYETDLPEGQGSETTVQEVVSALERAQELTGEIRQAPRAAAHRPKR